MKRYMKIWREHAIKREGNRLKVYKDSLGKLTVGIGHLVTKNDNLNYRQEITEEQCEIFFLNDSAIAEKEALRQAKETGSNSDEWIAALISVNFQLGTNWTVKFPNTWDHLKAKRYDDAIVNLRKSKWSKQTPVRVDDFIAAIEKLRAPVKQKPLRQSRTIAGGLVSGSATIASGALEIIQETQTQIEPLVPYADTLKIIFIALALAGIGLAIYARIDDSKKGRR